jgi:hypothetical protein
MPEETYGTSILGIQAIKEMESVKYSQDGLR